MSQELRERVEDYRRRKRQHTWTADLERACGVRAAATDFLSKDQTDRFEKMYYEKLKEWSGVHFDTFWCEDEFSELEVILAQVADRVPNLPVVLFNSHIGAIQVGADAVLRNARAVWDVVDDLCMATTGLHDGLCLEFGHGQSHLAGQCGDADAGIYELTVWGAFASGGKVERRPDRSSALSHLEESIPWMEAGLLERRQDKKIPSQVLAKEQGRLVRAKEELEAKRRKQAELNSKTDRY